MSPARVCLRIVLPFSLALVAPGAAAVTTRPATRSATAPAATAATTRSAAPDAAATPLAMTPLMHRIAQVVVEDRWRDAPGWRDPLIEAWVVDLLARVGAATGEPPRELPVQFANVQPLEKGQEVSGEGDMTPWASPAPTTGRSQRQRWRPATTRHARSQEQIKAERLLDFQGARRGNVLGRGEMITSGKLVVAREVRLARVERCIVLVDGNARIGYAHDCIIIARGVADVTRAEGSVIVAGQVLQIRSDGSHYRERPTSPPRVNRRGGVLISGGGMIAFGLSGSVCVSKEMVHVNTVVDCTLVNLPADAVVQYAVKPREVRAAPLRIDWPAHPLAGGAGRVGGWGAWRGDPLP